MYFVIFPRKVGDSMADMNREFSERHIEAVREALRRGSRVEVAVSKDGIRVYEMKMTRIDNKQK